jgi:twitching motility protein PilT
LLLAVATTSGPRSGARVADDEQLAADFYSQPAAAVTVAADAAFAQSPDHSVEVTRDGVTEPSAGPEFEAALRPAVVLPLARNSIHADSAPPRTEDMRSVLDRILRTAAARGASTVYLSSGAQPSLRADGMLQVLDGEQALGPSQVTSLLMALVPERGDDELRAGTTAEWSSEIEQVGRIRCLTFSDYRGPGAILRIMARAPSSGQLGLTREVQALASEPEGLVIIAGPRSSGKRTLIASLVDLINRTRRVHVIAIEREIVMAHSTGQSLLSQREIGGGDAQLLAAARAALREDPDVLVLEQIHTRELMDLALEASAQGHLVIGGMVARSASEAVDRALHFDAPERPRAIQRALADSLRGVVVQVLLPKAGGGRIAAREVLLASPAVAGLIAEGATGQLPAAIEGGRVLGMIPLVEMLVAYVQDGSVEISEACRYISDRQAFRTRLEQLGIDITPLVRLA